LLSQLWKLSIIQADAAMLVVSTWSLTAATIHVAMLLSVGDDVMEIDIPSQEHLERIASL
jgi:hypothetical protein